MAQVSTAKGTVEGDSSSGMYPAGWADHVTDRVDTLPIPAWLFYVLIWVALFLIETGVNWYSGVYPPGTFVPYHAIFTGLAIYGLAMVHYLDKVAAHALEAFRPALTGSDTDFQSLRYRLTTMPARASLVATIAGIGVGVPVAGIFGGGGTLSLTMLFDSPPSTALNFVLLTFVWCFQGLFLYHTWRQLRLVNDIYTTSAPVDLFRRHNLYSFSGLSARTAIGWLIIPYAGIISRPGVTSNIAVVVTAIVVTGVSVAIFVWPLVGVHRLMEVEKARLLDENGRRLKETIEETHRRLDAQDLSGIDNLKHAMDNLVTEQAVIGKIPTWPWATGTVGVLATALLLPIVLWIIERILERLMVF
jgi:hypothetical protein